MAISFKCGKCKKLVNHIFYAPSGRAYVCRKDLSASDRDWHAQSENLTRIADDRKEAYENAQKKNVDRLYRIRLRKDEL